MKKALSIGSVILVIVAVGVLGYYYFVFDKIDPETGKKASFREFLPFGRPDDGGGAGSGGNTGGGDDGNGGSGFGSGGQQGAELPKVRRIATVPVAGYAAYETASGTVVRYAERSTGNIFEYDVKSGVTQRVTNTTIPKVKETIWAPNGKLLVLRSLSDDGTYIRSYFGSVSTTTATGTGDVRSLDGAYLQNGIYDMAVLGSTTRMFTLEHTTNGTVGTVSNFNGSAPVIAYRSPARELAIQWATSDTVGIATKPGSYVNGYLYAVNARTGAVSKLLGPLPALTSLSSPRRDHVLYSYNGKDGLDLVLMNTATGARTPLSISTLASKCAWTADSRRAYCAGPSSRLDRDFADLWHQGVVSSNDDIWEIDTAGGTADLIRYGADLEGGPADMTQLKAVGKGPTLFYINKKDSILWMIELTTQEQAATSTPQS